MTDPPPQPVAEHPAGAGPLAARLAAGELVEWTAWGPTPIVSTFGHPQAEYAAIRKAVALVDSPQRGVLEVTGPDRHVFLNNLLTNGLFDARTKRPLPPGHGCYAFFLNLKGRIVADVRALAVSADVTLIECDRAAAPLLARTFEQYLFAEKVKLRDASGELHQLSLHGPEALSLLADAAEAGAPPFEPTPPDFPATADVPVTRCSIGGVEVIAFRDDLCGVPGLHLLGPRESAVRLWEDLTTRFGQTDDGRDFGRRRLRPVGWAMFNACRVEAGTPMLGIDFPAAAPSRPGARRPAQAQDEEPAEQPGGAGRGTLPAETGPLFAKAVSLTSGCYLGQEVVARMHARNVVARRIAGIRMHEDALPSAGAEVEVADQPVGVVTSSTISPVLSNACIALAMLKRPHFATGTEVSMLAEGRRARGTVVELPFIR